MTRPASTRKSRRSRLWSASTPPPFTAWPFPFCAMPPTPKMLCRRRFCASCAIATRWARVRDHRVWLIRIVWNIVLDRKRRAKTRPETDDMAELARVLPAGGLTAEQRAAAAQHHAQCSGLRGPAARKGARGAGAFGIRRAFQRGDCRGAGHHRIERSFAAVSRAQPDGRPARSLQESPMNPPNRHESVQSAAEKPKRRCGYWLRCPRPRASKIA